MKNRFTNVQYSFLNEGIEEFLNKIFSTYQEILLYNPDPNKDQINLEIIKKIYYDAFREKENDGPLEQLKAVINQNLFDEIENEDWIKRAPGAPMLIDYRRTLWNLVCKNKGDLVTHDEKLNMYC